MNHRQTQTPEYWSAFKITAGDVEYISNLLLEAFAPKRTNEMALALFKHRADLESATLRRQLGSQTLYQPKRQYQLDEAVVFPALNFANGRVVEMRAGHNPDLGTFDVITVEMVGGKRREFAANFLGQHRLNDLDVNALTDDADLQTPEQLYAAYHESVENAVNTALLGNSEFIRIKEEWFLREMMAEVNVGHLNLAEAVLDMSNGGPLTSDVLLSDLGLPADVAGSVQEISLNRALGQDERFDEISLNDKPAWFLRRLEPVEVRQIPTSLMPARFPSIYTTTISEELRLLATQLDDELEFNNNASIAAEASSETASSVLIFPHRRAGTLGWTRKLAAVLPSVDKPRIPVTFQDKANGKQFVVWLVRDGHYIYGLSDWYKQYELPVGASIQLTRSGADNIWIIDAKRHKPRREWVRVGSVRDTRLRLDTAQRAVTAEADELMAMFVDDPRTMDAMRGDQPREVAQSVREVFPEIAKLSPQGNVHARTLYSAVNVVTRAAPLDVFAALIAHGSYVPVGDNYWHLGD